MYVIKRTDKKYGNFSVTHDTLEAAIVEAERLARQHATENAEFCIYKLTCEWEVKGEIKVWGKAV